MRDAIIRRTLCMTLRLLLLLLTMMTMMMMMLYQVIRSVKLFQRETMSALLTAAIVETH